MHDQTLPCAVVRDLLPLHQEGLCGEETAALLKAHLAGCAACGAALAAMRAEGLPEKEPSLTEADSPAASLTAVRKTYRTVRVRALLLAVLAGVLAFAGLLALSGYLKQPTVPLTAGELDASALYLAPEGKVYCRLATDQYILHYSLGYSMWVDEAEGILYLGASRPRWPYAVTAQGREDSQYPDARRRDAALLDLMGAEMEDGRMVAKVRKGADVFADMEVRAVMLGNRADGYETLWQAGDAIAPAPDLSEGFMVAF